MANTYTQINIHVIFSVKGRENFLLDEFRPRLFEYLSGILRNIGQFPLAVNGYKDHVHLFFELHPTKSLSDVMEVVKANSSKWINQQKFLLSKFQWQKGFGGFSYSRTQRNDVIQYIMNQEQHRKQRSFKDEYLSLLEKFEIEFKEEYIFEFYD